MKIIKNKNYIFIILSALFFVHCAPQTASTLVNENDVQTASSDYNDQRIVETLNKAKRLCVGIDQILKLNGNNDEALLGKFMANTPVRKLETPPSYCFEMKKRYANQVSSYLRVEYEDHYGTKSIGFSEMKHTFYGATNLDDNGTFHFHVILFDDYGMIQIKGQAKLHEKAKATIKFYNFPSFDIALERAVEQYQKGKNVAELLGYRFTKDYWETEASRQDQQNILPDVLDLFNSQYSYTLGSFEIELDQIYNKQ